MRHRDSRAGFTLIELLVVIGLMAVLGTISVGGYFAASRGMKTNGAIQDAMSFIRNAQQVSLIEQMPTAVLFYNRYTGRADDGGEMYGTAVAIKMTGRISYVAGGLYTAEGQRMNGINGALVDEFADWNTSFPRDTANGNGDGNTLRLYNMADIQNTAKQGINRCSSLVLNRTGFVPLGGSGQSKAGSELLIASSMLTDEFCDLYQKNEQNNKNGCKYYNGNDYRWGLGIASSQDGLQRNDWHIGDPYGVEIGSFDLPMGYIFGSSIPSQDAKLNAANPAAIVFVPSTIRNADQYWYSFNTVSIYAYGLKGGEGVEKVGEIQSSKLKDNN